MRRPLLVFAGGFCGTLARYLLSAPLLSLAVLGLPGVRIFPYDILAINLVGALAVGLLYGLSDHSAALSSDLRLALGTGFLGAFTTFSTLAYGGEQLLAGGDWSVAALYLCGSLLAGVALARAGYLCAGLLVDHIAPRHISSARSVQARSVAWVPFQRAHDEALLRWAAGGNDEDVDERTLRTRVPDEVR